MPQVPQSLPLPLPGLAELQLTLVELELALSSVQPGPGMGPGSGLTLAMGNATRYPVPGQSQNLVALSMEFPARVRCSFVGISTTQSRLIARPSRLTVISNFQLVF